MMLPAREIDPCVITSSRSGPSPRARGVDLVSLSWRREPRCLPPRTRDRPIRDAKAMKAWLSPARTRGSTSRGRPKRRGGQVSPREVDPYLETPICRPRVSPPRTREPDLCESENRCCDPGSPGAHAGIGLPVAPKRRVGHPSSPRARGSTRDAEACDDFADVSPAHAGDRPQRSGALMRARRSPRARAGSTLIRPRSRAAVRVSPRTRGDRPAVEIVRKLSRRSPRARGDRPRLGECFARASRREVSGEDADLPAGTGRREHDGLPARGSTLVPTVGIARLHGLPRAREDRPSSTDSEQILPRSPAHAGIDPLPHVSRELRSAGLPRARGDRPVHLTRAIAA